MSRNDFDYWRESLAIAAEECELAITSEQLDCLADAISGSHENYGQAFYSPPASDRISVIENEWRSKLKEAEKDAERRLEQADQNAEELRRRINRIANQRDDAIRELERSQ